MGELDLPPLPGNFLSLFKFFEELGQRRATEVESSEGRDWREEEDRGKVKDGQILPTVEATLGSQEMLGMEGS